jgi:hypothetical protein
MGVLADSHPGASGDALGRVRLGPREPEGRVFGTEIPTVPFRTDRKGLGETARAAGEIRVGNPGSSSPHDLEPEDGLEGAQEDSRPDALPTGRHVDEEMNAVATMDVRVSSGKEEGGVASRASAVGVAGSVVGQVGFHFDDAARRASFGSLVDKEAAEKESGEGERRFGKIRAPHARPRIQGDGIHVCPAVQAPAVRAPRSWGRHGMLIRLGASPSRRSAVRLRPQ